MRFRSEMLHVYLALQVHVDGVHVGQKDEGIQSVLDQAAGKLIVGYSCNTPEEVVEANKLSGVDCLGVEPVFPTKSKDDAVPALGLV